MKILANKYCNLDGTKKIKDEYKKINIGFDKVEEDLVAHKLDYATLVDSLFIEEGQNWEGVSI